MNKDENDQTAARLIKYSWGCVFVLGLLAIAAATQLCRYTVYTVSDQNSVLVVKLDRLTGHTWLLGGRPSVSEGYGLWGVLEPLPPPVPPAPAFGTNDREISEEEFLDLPDATNKATNVLSDLLAKPVKK